MANQSRKALLGQIRQLQFIIIELTLFLDTHPNDKAALDYHDNTVSKLNQLKKVYNRDYGMLTPADPSPGSWEWVESPWPWEKNFEED